MQKELVCIPLFNPRFSDTWLLPFALGSALMPSILHLSLWTTLSVLTLFIWYGLLHLRFFSRLGTGGLIATAVMLAGLVWFDYGTLIGRDAGTALAIQMVTLKLLEASSRRERVFVYVAGYCLLFCSFLFSQSMSAVLLCIPALVFLTAGLMETPMNQVLGLKRRIRLAGIMLLQATPFMLAGFLLFPRSEFARWNLPSDAVKAMTGFSGILSPGGFTQLAKSDAVAFRVQFYGAIPPRSVLYWRGRVLTLFDGAVWHGDEIPDELMRQDLHVVDAASHYTVTLEPHNQPWLFALDVPIVPPAAALLTSEHTIQSIRPVQAVMTYEGTSALTQQQLHRPGRAAMLRNLQLPSDENPRSLALAQEWRDLDEPMMIVEEALALFRKDFRYTLNPPAIKSFDQVDAFLFKTRSGFCEHYAGSFVFLMRAAGVPARVVTGYQGGEIDANTGIVTVRQAHAHAWAEVWMAERGWVRVDPVTVLPGSSVDSGTPAPPSPQLAADVPRSESSDAREDSLASRVEKVGRQPEAFEQGISHLQHNWNRYVLSYRERAQLRLLQRITDSKTEPLVLLTWYVMTLVVGAVMLGWWLGRRVGQAQDPYLQAWQIFQNKCARAGFKAEPTEGPQDYSERCMKFFPSHSREILTIRDAYIQLRYAKNPPSSIKRELDIAVRRFRPCATPPVRSPTADISQMQKRELSNR